MLHFIQPSLVMRVVMSLFMINTGRDHVNNNQNIRIITGHHSSLIHLTRSVVMLLFPRNYINTGHKYKVCLREETSINYIFK